VKRNNEARMLVAQGSPVNVEKAGVSGSISDKLTYLDRGMELVWTLKHLDKTSWQRSSTRNGLARYWGNGSRL
jgi:hypothetical protein